MRVNAIFLTRRRKGAKARRLQIVGVEYFQPLLENTSNHFEWVENLQPLQPPKPLKPLKPL